MRPSISGLFGLLERLALFALSATIGLVDLAVALFVAANLGVIPKDKVRAFRQTAARAPLVGRLFSEKKAAPAKSKAKPVAPK